MAKKIEIEIIGDTSSLERALNRSGKKVSTWQKGLQKAGKVAAIGLLAVGAGAIKATRDASHLNEMISATEVIFGNASDAIIEWSKDTSDAFSQADFLGAAKSFAVFAQQAGLGEKATASFSKQLVEAAGDLASFHDADPTEVLENLRSGLAGETEPLRKFGILIDEASVQQQAMKMGLIESGEALTAREKIIARQALILDQMGAAQGDWNRTRDSAANKERTAIANAKDLSAQLGQALLPAYQKILQISLQLVGVMGRHKTATKAVVIALVALAAALVVATVAQTAMNLAVLANPYVAAAVAVVALSAAIVILVKKVDFFRQHWQLLLIPLGVFPVLVATIVKAVIRHFDTLKGWFNQLKETAQSVFPVIAAYINTLIGPLLTVIGLVQDAIGFFRDLVGASGSSTGASIGAAVGRAHGRQPPRAMGGPVSRGVAYTVGERGPELFVPRSSGRIIPNGGGGGGSVNVIVLGGDREAINYLRQLDYRSSRRSGRGVF